MKSTIIKLILLTALGALGAAPVVAQSADDADKEQKQREKVQAQAERAQERGAQEALEKVQGELDDRLSQIQDRVKRKTARVGQTIRFAQGAPAALPVPGIPEPPEPYDAAAVDFVENAVRFGNGNFNYISAGQSPAQPLVISTSDPSPVKLGETQEDLSVMARILRKAAERIGGRDKHENAAMGIAISSLHGGQRAESFYLEGYGAMFTLNVRYPLVPPPAVEETKAETTPDTTWEKTKRELYGPRGPVVAGGKVDMFLTDKFGGDGPAMTYEAERVDSLKQGLLKALKNGANLRHVKADEQVVVAVVGPASRGAVTVERLKSAKGKKKPARNDPSDDSEDAASPPVPRVEVLSMTPPPGAAAARQTNLIIRARKSDIDAFAKGELDLDAFSKKASVQVY
ncbi:MAG: hypothetical protein HY043_15860 [Verrucomicrobia bacterium]|nr:hypothetical protein [Verrucomicrobiota bacterium]